MQDNEAASDSGRFSEHGSAGDGDWEQAGSPKGSKDGSIGGSGQAAGQKSGKKDLSHVACRFYRVGACTAGASCPFSHSAREPGQSKQICKWFVKGQCKFGHKCANAHVLPGQPASMDWKNKKAAKQAAQADAVAHANIVGASGPPPAPGVNSPKSAGFPPESPGMPPNGDSGSRSTAPSGLSSMFGRSAVQQQPGYSMQAEHQYLQAMQVEQAGAAIGMSPVGLPLPADLQIPKNGTSQAFNGSGEMGAENRPKPVSYASAVGSAAIVGSPTASSPIPTSRIVNHEGTGNADAGLMSPNRIQAPAGNGSSITSANLPAALSPTAQSYLSRMSSSVPAAAAFDRGPYHAEGVCSPMPHHLAHQPHVHSPLAPNMQQSHSHTSNLPTRSLLNSSRPPASPSLATIGSAPGSGMAMPVNNRTASSSSVFGTSPFANNAIFLSTSHDEDKEAYISRSARNADHARQMSPIGYERSSLRSGGITISREGPRMSGSQGTLRQGVVDDEDDDDNVLEEELVPSSLKHLLTPDEKRRRESRSGGRSGFFNPFDDTEDDAEEERELQKYSRSVPAAPAGGFPRTFANGPTASLLSTLANASAESSQNAALLATSPTSNLAKHLLSNQTPGIARMSTSPAPPGLGAANPRLGALAGTSLPQGLAVGLQKMHIGSHHHTGYTPQSSYANSPPIGSPPVSAAQTGSLLNPASANRPNFAPSGSSYVARMPTLANVRRVSSNHADIPTVGSPLARAEMAHYAQTSKDFVPAAERERALSHAPSAVHEHEEDDLVFDMDV